MSKPKKHRSHREWITSFGDSKPTFTLVPLCVGASTYLSSNYYSMYDRWEHVTCKHCLKKRKL